MCLFLLIFCLYFYSLPYLEICTDQVNSTSTLSTTIYIMWIFFPIFLAIFVLITILGNVHRPCIQYSNIVNNSPLFLFFSSNFLDIISYQEMCTDHQQYSIILFYFFCDFLALFSSITLLISVARPHYTILQQLQRNSKK